MIITFKNAMEIINTPNQNFGDVIKIFIAMNYQKAIDAAKIKKTQNLFNDSDWRKVVAKLNEMLPVKIDADNKEHRNIRHKNADSSAVISKMGNLWQVRGNHNDGQAFGDIFGTKTEATYYAYQNVL